MSNDKKLNKPFKAEQIKEIEESRRLFLTASHSCAKTKITPTTTAA